MTGALSRLHTMDNNQEVFSDNNQQDVSTNTGGSPLKHRSLASTAKSGHYQGTLIFYLTLFRMHLKFKWSVSRGEPRKRVPKQSGGEGANGGGHLQD